MGREEGKKKERKKERKKEDIYLFLSVIRCQATHWLLILLVLKDGWIV